MTITREMADGWEKVLKCYEDHASDVLRLDIMQGIMEQLIEALVEKPERKSPLVDQETCKHVIAYAGTTEGVALFCSLCGKRLDGPEPLTKPIVIPRKPPAPYTQERAGYVPGIGGTCPYCGCDSMTIVDDKAVCWDCFLIMLWPPDKDRVLDGYTVPPDDPAKQHNEPLAKDWVSAIYSK